MEQSGKMRRTALSVVLILFMAIAFLPLGNLDNVDRAEAASMKKVKKSQYTKLVQGNLTKNQLNTVLHGVVSAYGIDSKGKGKKTFSKKAINRAGRKKGKDWIIRHVILLYGMKNTYTDSGYMKFKLNDVNRALSCFTKYRYKNGENHKNGGCKIKTKNNYFYIYTAIGIDTYSKITSAKYNSKKMIVNFKVIHGYDIFKPIKYKATLKKQSNQKYRLVKIVRVK